MPASAPRAETTRFAPSPTGPLHLGHAFAALVARRAARETGGRFLLRIEDLDAGRCRPEHAAALEAELRWLGLGWDGTPRVQSRHHGEYAAALERLREAALLYPCFCTRAEVAREVAAVGGAPHGPEGPPYPGTCRRLDPGLRAARLAEGMSHAWRLDLSAALRRLPGAVSHEEVGRGRVVHDLARLGDPVLGRRDAPVSYHLCVAHDDARQGVTLVTRGEDLRAATGLHRVLQALLGWPEPRYRHHKLLLGPDGRRLSKRDGAATLRSMREAGRRPAEVLALASA